MDYLDSIDCSLEDFQAMLYGKPFSIDPNIEEVCWDVDNLFLPTSPSICSGNPIFCCGYVNYKH